MKGYTALSLLGLIISLSGTVIIARYLYQEWTIDQFMPELDRTYICCVQYQNSNEWFPMETYDPNHQEQFVSPVLNQSDVECWTNVRLRSMFPLKPEQGEVFYPQALSVDSNFTSVYPLEPIEGTLVLQTKGQCILSEELAKRLFPSESAVGKTVIVEDNEVNTVMGVFRQPATKSTIHFDIANFNDEGRYGQNSRGIGLIRLCEGTNMQAYNERQPEQRLAVFSDRPVHFGLQPYTQMLQKCCGSYWTELSCLVPVASSSHLWMLLFVAVLLLFVGLFNFVNLFAVMRSHRRHELEVRRIFGASRWNIFCQLYAETFLLSVLTMVGVWTVVELAEPLLATYYNIEVMGQWKFDVGLTLIILFGLPLITSLTPGPSPVGEGSSAAKVPLSLGRGVRGKAFMFFQFFISLALLNVSIYFMRQLHVMMTADPGFRTKGLLSACIYPPSNRVSWSEEEWEAMIANLGKQTEVVKQRLQACPYIKCITVDSRFVSGNYSMKLADGRTVDIMYIGSLEAQMYGLQLVEGVLPGDSLSM